MRNEKRYITTCAATLTLLCTTTVVSSTNAIAMAQDGHEPCYFDEGCRSARTECILIPSEKLGYWYHDFAVDGDYVSEISAALRWRTTPVIGAISRAWLYFNDSTQSCDNGYEDFESPDPLELSCSVSGSGKATIRKFDGEATAPNRIEFCATGEALTVKYLGSRN